MAGMDIDSPPQTEAVSSRDRILRILAKLGVPKEYVDQQQAGLVDYVKKNKQKVSKIVSAILPTDEEAIRAVSEAEAETTGSILDPTIEELYAEGMFWLQWLMFECNPKVALKRLSGMNVGRHGVCGAVLGNNDIAYQCRTCGLDPTCAICGPCFQDGDHKDHDYSIIIAGVGCCDCGDVTAWNHEGFCSKHKGAEQIQPLQEELASSIRPVLDSVLNHLKWKLIVTEKICKENPRYDNNVLEMKKVAEKLTSAVMHMLLEFCKFDGSLVKFISWRVCSLAGLLDMLVKAERFLSGDVVKRLHELLMKLLGESQFKSEFARVFLSYYPTVVTEATTERNDNVLKKCRLLSTFSLQIFTVLTLTPRLVKEMNLLAMLLDCLRNIFISCSGVDGRLELTRWANLYETTLHVVKDIQFVMSQSVVPMYVARDWQDISRTCMELLAFLQGMCPQKRKTGIAIDDENKNSLPFVLVHYIANICSILVWGAFSVNVNEESEEEGYSKTYQQEVEDQDSATHAEVQRMSRESSVISMTGRNPLKFAEIKSDDFPVPLTVLWLTCECLKAIDNWLRVDSTKESALSLFSKVKRTAGKHGFGSFNASSSSAPPVRADLGGSDDNEVKRGYATEKEAPRVLSLSDWPDTVYDVSSHEISVHIPLHRLLSMLLQRALRKCYGESLLPKMKHATSEDAPSEICQDFFGQILDGCHPYGFSAFVMEHPLRIRVFHAAVHAGMWRRNESAAMLSYRFYKSAKWCEQGLERDLFLLQCCAAQAPADHFVQRILERFGLSDFLSLNLKRSSVYESILVQEMLTLIIQIVKERRFCGFTTAECLQRELVYKLSHGDATRSELEKSLPCELSKFDKFQEILDTVAVYSDPSDMNQGKYKLRLEYWMELDLYHPRWSSRNLQIAGQRYMDVCHNSALTAQLPRWSKIYHPLSGIARIATCKTVLQIVRAVLYYYVFPAKSTASRALDDVLLRALHLLSLALDICCCAQGGSGDRLCYVGDVIPVLEFASEEIHMARHGDQSLLSLLVLLMRIHESEMANNFDESSNFNQSSLIQHLIKKFAELEPQCKTKLQKLAPELVKQLTGSASIADTSPTGLNLDGDKKKSKARERQASILEKMRAQQSKFLESIGSSPEDDGDDSDIGNSAKVTCSFCHDDNSEHPVSYLIFLQKSKLLSFVERGPPPWEQGLLDSWAQVLHAIEDFASDGQPAEVRAFLKFIGVHFPSFNKNIRPSTLSYNGEKIASSPEEVEKLMYSQVQEKMAEDISVAGGILERSSRTESLLLGKYIASVSKETTDNPSALVDLNSHSNKPQPDKSTSLLGNDGFGASDCDGIYLSSCGHAVHQGCLDRYLSSLNNRGTEGQNQNQTHPIVQLLDEGEFLCPHCRGLANCVLPALPGDFKGFPRPPASAQSHVPVNTLRIREALCLLESAANVTKEEEILKSIPLQWSGRQRSNLESVFQVISSLYGKDKISRSGGVSHMLLLWDALKYSLISIEIAARSRNISLTPEYSLDALYGELKSSGGFIISLLLDILQSTRTENSPSVLFRMRGIQLFAESICSGISSGFGGKMQHLLERLKPEVQYPDIQLWKQASHPILAQDPFSSLMWTLFCLPSAFFSCEDSFLCLVHLFYLVTIAQAIITCCKKKNYRINELEHKEGMILDIYSFLGKYDISQYFDCNYLASYSGIKEAIRGLSFPYLRRCALLWRLLKHPLNFGNHVVGEYTRDNLGEFIEIEKLEQIFKIPSLDVVVDDRLSCSVILRWLHHFSEHYKIQNRQCVLYSTPAVPFRLMLLPNLYQDVFQRYSKRHCPDCGAVQEKPVLCLLCGKLCSPNRRTCCSESRCQTHAMTCSAGAGVFLWIKGTSILLQRSARHAPCPSPYLNAYGEEDNEMQQGKPLYLNEERYAALTHMVASHGVQSRIVNHLSSQI